MNFLKNKKAITIAASLLFVCTLALGVPVAQATSLTSVQINAVISLLQAFGVDSGTIANVQSVLDGTATSTLSVPSITYGESEHGQSSLSTKGNNTACMGLSTNLSIGSTDHETEGEVSRLQSFLGSTVTGYFGSITEDALQHWQTTHGIVATGSPETTGFGIVGPHTRGEINREFESECANNHDNTSIATSTVSEDHSNASTTEATSTSDTATSSQDSYSRDN